LRLEGIAREDTKELDDLLLDALRVNSTLKFFSGFPAGSQQILYLFLNQFKRSELRDPETTPVVLTEILPMVEMVFAGIDVRNDASTMNLVQRQNINASSVQYGLLLESVGIWTNSTC
jgi:hypothetical protein